VSSTGAKTYTAYDPQANSFSNPAAVKIDSISVGVDSKGNVISGSSSGTGQVVKHSPTGAKIWDTGPFASSNAQCIANLHGIIIDDNDDIWVVDNSGNRLLKYGAGGNYITAVPVGKWPYTYGNPPPPTCGGSTVTGVATHNKDKSDCAKGSICFDYTVPNGPAGAGTVDLSLELYQNGAVVNTLTSGPLTTSGTYCFTNFLAGLDASVGGFDWKMTATFTATGTTVPPVVVGTTGEGFVPGKNNDCPLTPPPGCAQVTGEAHCLPNGDYSYTFNVTHNSGNVMSQVLLTPVKGSTFTLTPQLTNLSPPLAGGQSATVTTNIRNAKPGDNVCFFVCLMSETAPCCIVQVCLTMPVCGGIENPATTAKPPNPTNRPNQTNPPSVAPPPRRPPLRDRRRP
jgi:hypothetical protein